MQHFLSTNRLKIRIETADEYCALFQQLPDEALKSHLGFSDERLLSQKKKVAGGLTTYRNKILFFQLIEKNIGNVIGCFVLHNWYPEYGRAEMGAEIYTDELKNKGLMSEAMQEILIYSFGQLRLNRIEAIIDPANAPSIAVVEKLGFSLEARLKEHYCCEGIKTDSLLYTLLYNDYAGQKKLA